VRGYIVDGGCRDVQAIIDERFPVFSRFATPIDIVCAWRAEAFEVPIAIGGIAVHPDDYVLADRDGAILIGSANAAEVVTAAEAKMTTEGEMVKAIRAGEDPQAAYLKHRVF
jgi:regulator of RNase E activity RraA